MDSVRFENLYDAFRSQILFNNHMNNLEDSTFDLLSINFNLLKAIYSSFYLTTVLDPFIEKNSDGNVKIKLNDDFLDALIKNVAKYNGSGYAIGELSYKSSTICLDKIRNKLAHGDYIVNEENIIFEENGAKGIINLDKLVGMILNLDFYFSKYMQNGESIKIKGNCKYVLNRKVNGIPSFKNYCKDLPVLIIKDEPVNKNVRNQNYINFVEQMSKKITELFKQNEYNDKQIKKYIELNKPLMEKLGISLTYEIKSVYDLDCYDKLVDEYKNNYNNIKNLNGQELSKYLFNRILKLSKGKFQKFNYSKGLAVSLFLIKCFSENDNMNYDDIKKQFPNLNFILNVDIENAIIATNLVNFYSFYQFGLEKGLTEKGNYDLAKIVKNLSLDFSLLDLSLLDDENMIVEHNFLNYQNDIQKYKLKEAPLINRIEKCRNNLYMYLNNVPQEKQDKEKINKLKSILKDAFNSFRENVLLINEMDNFSSTFDFDKYVRNINIIEHIRNSISHGNIFVDEYCMDIKKKKIIINDYLDDKLCYSKTVTADEFLSLFSINNSDFLNKFFEDKIDKNKIKAK